ncbi:MAG: alpha/beta fold hydrolase [Acidimicrobiia bacterium]
MPEERFVDRGGVRLQYLQDGDHPELTPVVYVPGGLSGAALFTEEMERLLPRRSAAVSLRGRGGSDAPERGYSFEDQVADLAAIVADLGWESFCLMAYSMGVPIALGWAADHPDRLGGLVILDYPARYPARTPRWVEETRAAFPDHPAHVIERLHQEAEEVLLWDRLAEVTCPVLVIYGGQPQAALRSEDADRYRELLPQARLVVFADSDHQIWQPDYERLMGEIETFLSELDAG